MLFSARPALLALISTVLSAVPLFVHADEAEKKPGAAFSLVENDRFAARASGLPGAITAEASANAKTLAAARQTAVLRTRGDAAARARLTRQLRAIGALGAHTPLRQPRIVAYTRGGALPKRSFSTTATSLTSRTTRRSTTRAVSPLLFKTNGFSAQQKSDFDAFIARVYPLMTALYGDPAPAQQGRTVEIRFDNQAGDGLYELPSSGQTAIGGIIRYDPINADSSLSAADALRINEYNLARKMLIAFRGAQILSFDAWELGMTDAAALIVAYQLHPSSSFDPSSLGVYLLPIYDILNRPELGNPFFFSAGASPSLGFYRGGMAQAAWLKVWVENRTIFRSFNASYYANFNQSGFPLAGNTPALKAIVKGIVPMVEGLEFNDWYRRQQVLDTAVTTGEKLWLAVVPQPNLTSGDTRSVFLGVVERYRTASNGDETPIGGAGTARAVAETGQDVTLKSEELRTDNRVLFNSLGEAELNSQNVASNSTPIIGFENVNALEKARLRVVVTAGQAQSEAFFPYGVAGTEAAISGFYGAVVNGQQGRVAISTTARSASASLTNGAFGDAGKYPSAQAVVTTYTLTPTDGAAPKTWKRNGAWSYASGRSQSFAAILETAPGNAAFAKTFGFSGDNRLRLISLPLYPVQTDEADVLGIERTRLLLARYRTNLAPTGFTQSGITYGITADKHELYPNIAEPFAPGRGYWLKLNQSLATTVKGGQPSTSTSFEVPLLGGWNAVGVPFNRTFALSSVRISYGGQTTDFAGAVKANWLGGGVWGWKPEGGYARIDSGTAANQTLQPFEGYFVFSRFARGLKLIFDPRTTEVAAITRSAITAQNWSVPLVASSNSARDETSAWGVTAVTNGVPITRSAARPPAGSRSLTLSFLTSGNPEIDRTTAGKVSGWAESLVAPDAPRVWKGLVDGAWPEQTVAVQWGDISRLPVSIDATFIDEKSGQRINMAQTRVFRFVSDGTARRFQIEATPRPAAILGLSARQLAGSRVIEIGATFGLPGRATLDIETPDGDLVRNIAAESVASGKRRWNWSGLNSAGRSVAGGTYSAHLTMRDDRGVETEKTVRFELE